ncbi:MAG TPA: O-antigen ligase family protein [Candidatus Sulfomarinibacteraceae bacterium]|nr:O-antigen ligase family protein [Candidatus Sulfomarinibacteraceae bacterium]
MSDAPPATAPGESDAASLLEAGWLLAAVLIPLWVNLWAHQPFEPSKAILLRSLVWLLVAAALAGALLRGKGTIFSWQHNPLLWPVVLLGAVLVATTAFAPYPRLSLFGSYARGQGLLTWLSYLLLFLLVSAGLRRRGQARRLLQALALSGAPLALLGLLQAAGVDPLGLTVDTRSPIYATLGRSNFVGAYAAMLLPAALALAVMARQRGRGRLWGALFLILLVLLTLTLSRAAWAAALVSVGAFGGLYWWPRLARRGRLALLAGGVVAALLGTAGGAYALLSANSGSLAARRRIWAAVWDLIQERPLLGYGLDALEVFFPAVYPPELVYYQGREVFVDRAHNVLLEWLAAAGTPGAVAFLFLVGAFFVLAWRRLQLGRAGSEGRAVVAACAAAVAGNLIGNLGSFDVTATAMASWLLMAVVASPALGREREEPSPARGAAEPTPARMLAAAGLFAAVAFLVVQLNGRPLAADVAHQMALRRAAQQDGVGAMAAAQKAAAYAPWEPAHRRLLAELNWQQAQRAGGDRALLARAEAQLLAARDLRPADYVGWAALGEFYAVVGMQFDTGTLTPAHESYEQAVARAPHYARLHVAWARVYLAQDRPEEAGARLQRAVDLDATDGLALRMLGDVALAQGRPQEALAWYREAERWSADAALVHVGLARSYWALQQPAQAEQALTRALALDAEHPDVQRAKEQLMIVDD